MRLDKFLTETGVGTRSEVKKLIKSGAVTVNGARAGKPELKIDENADVVCCGGQTIAYQAYEYYLFHKPAGCVTATEDGLHRTVMDYLTQTARKDLFPVGRLDLDTEGLLLITNDGALAHRLLSPAHHVPKTYFAKIAGCVTVEDKELFAQGIEIGDDKPARPASLVILKAGEESEVTLTITEGRFHQVKRMFEAVGKKVLYLKRLSMAGLVLPEELRPGEYRALTAEELDMLGRI